MDLFFHLYLSVILRIQIDHRVILGLQIKVFVIKYSYAAGTHVYQDLLQNYEEDEKILLLCLIRLSLIPLRFTNPSLIERLFYGQNGLEIHKSEEIL